jgi:hypothetical protein
MPGVEYDGDTAAPKRRSEWLVVAALAAVVLLVWTRGVVTLLVVALAAVLIGLVVAIAAAAVKGLGRSGDHPIPTLSAGGGPAAQRSEAGHESPTPSR